MTRLETALVLGAATLTSAGIAAARHGMWWETSMFWFVAVFLAEGASRERHQRRARERAVAVRLACLARGEAVIEPPRPCCQFWVASDGAVHGHDCIRPPAARTSLSLAEQQALAEITARYDEDAA
ncbi:hypothetical protein ACFXC8_00295 [Streptomyces sp. NPDC059441]|uniref:hypothetical protein n=1 Tax=Streptomyces sp. NPDC059441 TaxID=3346829 RepID=UPI003689CE1C